MAGVGEQRAERHQDVGYPAQRDRRRGQQPGAAFLEIGEIRSIGTCHVWSDYRDRAIRFSVRVLQVLPAGLLGTHARHARWQSGFGEQRTQSHSCHTRNS